MRAFAFMFGLLLSLPGSLPSSAAEIEGALSLERTRVSVLENATNTDVFELNLRARNEYLFELRGPRGSYMSIRDASGRQVTLCTRSNSCFNGPVPSGVNAQLFDRVVVSGRYYLTIGSGGSTGRYEIRYRLWDLAPGPTTEARMRVGSRVSGRATRDYYPDDRLNELDEDARRISLRAGQNYRFSVTFNYPPGRLCFGSDQAGYITLYNSNSQILGEAQATTPLNGRYSAFFDKIILTAGDYFVSVTGCGEYERAQYSLLVQTIPWPITIPGPVPVTPGVP